MSRILAIDYGSKKTGLAVTDPLRIIAAPLVTIPSSELFNYLDRYLADEDVAEIIVGEPFLADGTPAQFHSSVIKFVEKLQKRYSDTPVFMQDETNSSKEAKRILLNSGAKKGKRRDKTIIDRIAASLILEDYLKEKGIF